MLEIIKNLPVQIEQGFQKYFPIYIDWLTGKLDAENAFGTLAIVAVATFAGLFIYLHVRNNLE